MVNGSRLKQIRELRQFTQSDLAQRVGVEQAAIAMIEAGRRQPSDELLKSLGKALEFPEEYFCRGHIEDFPLGSLLFRAPAAMTARQESSAHRHAQVLFEIVKGLARQLKPLPVRLPRLVELPPANAAKLTRSMLGLSPDSPIDHLIHTLERAGVVVIAIPAGPEKHEAFSGWAGTGDAATPVIVVYCGKPGDRLRFSVAHELCHLVCHQAAQGRISELEKQADAFSAEFLTPGDALRHELVPPITLSSLAPLKPRWKVSIRSLIMRTNELGFLTLHQYKYLNKQMVIRGWDKQEPPNLSFPAEIPQTFTEVIGSVYGRPFDVDRLAKDFAVSPAFLQEIIDSHNPSPQRVRRGQLTLLRTQ